jgi:hypothetical protein
VLQIQTSPLQSVPRAAAQALPALSALPVLSLAQARQLSMPATDHVIVVLRDQAQQAGRAALLQELAQVGARSVHAFQVINAVSATISPAEAARLRSDPAVLSVSPDQVIQLASPARVTDGAAGPANATLLSDGPLTPACTTSKTPSLEPEALQLTYTASTNPHLPEAQRLRGGNGVLIDGKGVKVGFIADGLDINNPDFKRNGRSIFVDYQDFSGDGPTAPTTGGEAFLDASSIAAQGNKVYDVNNYLVNPLPRPCPIRIVGVAPGASLVGLKVFGQNNATTTSAFVQAIDYAVSVEHVNVLNESFGSNPFPDLENDPISLADDRAVAAGVTVTVSTGDAGIANTLGSPSTDAGVITVGATTQYRAYTQVDANGIGLGSGGYVDNNISAFSSSGFSQIGPRTVDVVAPGDLGWALCTPDTRAYSDCTTLDQRTPSSIELTGGTSEAAPLTAGEAALVIQAYRSTHHNANPSPLVVKQIITSTATDLGIPASLQGAGLIDSYRAVEAALSFHDTTARPSPRGNELLIAHTTAFTATAAPNVPERFSFLISNEGSHSQYIAPRLRTLGKTVFTSSATLYLDPLSDPNTFTDEAGVKRAYIERNFAVPPGVQQLNAAISWLALQETSAVVRLDLFDPANRLAAFSDPQSQTGLSSGFGQVNVRNPAAGLWKAVIWTRATPTTGVYAGAVHFAVTGARFVPVGAISPRALILPPGHSATFTIITHMPGAPGDSDQEVVFPAPGGVTTLAGAIPVSLRALVPLHAGGGSFSGILTGGNGRFGSPGQTLSYQFDVPAGLHELQLALRITNPSTNLEGVLIDPYGQPIDIQTLAGHLNSDGLPDVYTGAMEFFRRDPVAGRWLFVLSINNTIGGSATAQPFQATISFNGVRLLSRGIPTSKRTVLHPGKPVVAEIALLNTGVTTKDFFLDPRLATTGLVPLQAPDSYSVSLPITASEILPPFVVPSEVSALTITAHAPSPVAFDAFQESGTPPFGGTGSPDVYQSTSPTINPLLGEYEATVSVQAPEVAPGLWGTSPEELGPFGGGGAGPSTVDISAVATGEPFDRQVSTTTGDVWSPFAASYRPLTLSPGQIGEIRVRISPRGLPGTVVHGFLYLDTLNLNSLSGDELMALPYTYTIGK